MSNLSLCLSHNFTKRSPRWPPQCVVLGDFNTNVMNLSKNNPLVNAMCNLERMFGLTQLISEPTRVCTTSESIIDLIFVSHSENISQSGVITIGVSDHLITFCTRKVTKCKHKFAKLRSLKKYGIFIQKLISKYKPVYSYSTNPDRRFSSSTSQHF